MSKMNEEVNVNEDVVVEFEDVEVACEVVNEKKSMFKKAVDFCGKCGNAVSEHKKQIAIGAGIALAAVGAYVGFKHFNNSKDIVELVDVTVLEDVVEDVTEVVEDQIAE